MARAQFGPGPNATATAHACDQPCETYAEALPGCERLAIPALADAPGGDCPCRHALELAIWSEKSKVAPDVVQRMEPLIGRYFS